MNLLFQNVIRLNKVNLLRGFYVSIYSRSTNLKNIWYNPYKINVRFVKKQPLKKSAPTIFLKMFLFNESFCIFSSKTETYSTLKHII